MATTGFAALEHELRHALNDELHARPPVPLATPVEAVHIAVLSSESEAEADSARVAALCRSYGIAAPPAGARHHSAVLGPTRIKWERHTEFSTVTLFRAPDAPEDGRLLQQWLRALPGRLLVAARGEVRRGDEGLDEATLSDYFRGEAYVGSLAADGWAKVWTDFRIRPDGFTRILVADRGMGPRKAGRVLQRLFEIETYRMMALLALPAMQRIRPELSLIEERLGRITGTAVARHALDAERVLLAELGDVAARTEAVANRTGYRLAASRAYYAIVRRNIAELREQRLEDLQTVGEFLDRRLAPAMRSCEAAAARHEALSQRIARATSLLRTRVDVALEGRSQALLQEMHGQAGQQLRLQETVEGLSIVAIGYYAVGLLGVLLQPLYELYGLPYPLLKAAAVPLVLLVAWAGMRRLKRRALAHAGG
ncbi:MAG TPA: DUF3422 domain-containing protein [Alphaproteobacteria bacterium]|nr:DUF3422 domain-containing protein [Alphaproteobacteria bacterium]